MNRLSLVLLALMLLVFTGCSTPSLSGKKVKKEYFTGGQLRSEFIMDDDTGQNGVLKQYGYDGKLTSIVTMRNGVKDGIETGYDPQGRVIWKLNFVNGKQEGEQYAYYPNGDVMLMFTYVGGIKHGPAISYHKNGAISKQVMYENGRVVN